MAEKTGVKKGTRPPSTSTKGKGSQIFSDEEKAAAAARVREVAARRGGEANGEGALLASVAALKQPDRGLAERINRVVKTSALGLSPTTWYGMPAYAKDGKIICHFQPAQKFKTRYATLGFSDKAKLDDGQMWPVAFAVTELNAAEEARIRALLKQALS